MSILASLRVWLERDFEKEEVRATLLECGVDKAPRPDSFNFSFIWVAWDIVKKDFCEMLSGFHWKGRLNKETIGERK